MHAKRHALLARLLIEANGGLEKSADNCRLDKSQLQRFCDTRYRQWMPADVIDDLEAACGRKIYSLALAAAEPSTEAIDSLLVEACEFSEETAILQRAIRKAVEDGRIDEVLEGPQIDRLLELTEQRLRDLRAARDRSRPA
ncbi:hypothetical protein [Caulobacter segnis]|uniref:hypothetical protein n=1 Tax=Caulobacter segnis TaxID=88688 RepID=UPI0026EAC46F|nr:hypothetical protein [Caulobacter segnis]